MRTASRREPLGRTHLFSTTRRCAETDALAFFADAARSANRTLWLRPDANQAIVGVGSALVLEAEGADRFASIATAWRALLTQAEIQGPLGPRLLGGFSFDPERTRTELWNGFPDARFVLPERMLTLADGAAWLTTNSVLDLDEGNARLAQRAAPFL